MKVRDTVISLMRQGRGILAADESTKTITERFDALGIPSTPETRRAYRELLFTTEGVEQHLSGVILYEETLKDAMSDGTPFADYLISKNIHVGIKVDQGLVDDPQFPGGEVTKGLDGLAERLREYAALGAVFTKWRAVARVGDGFGDAVLRENASRMAAYAEIAIAEGFAPIVEPEVLMDGTHTAAEAEDAIVETLSVTVDALQARNVDLKNVIIKTAMAVSGSECETRVGADEVAERTMRALTAALPDDVGGVVFLSGGQSPEEATRNLNALSRIEPLPWPITFSFSRALQNPALSTWKGDDANRAEAQAAFSERLHLAVAADAAGYSKNEENDSLAELQ